MDVLVEILAQTWQLVLQAAAFLLLGFVLAGLIHALLPAAQLVRWLGAPRWPSVLMAAVIGTPLPLCSCAVVPVATALRKRGASRGATTAFLISTPESGIDSIAITYALMDPIMTIARPVAAMLTALAAGIAQNLWGGDRREAADCCDTVVPTSDVGCRDGAETAPPTQRPARLVVRLVDGLRYGLVEMFEDLSTYLVGGFLLAGILGVALNTFDVRAALGSVWAPLIMLAVGVPMYVCASAATPMIAVLIAAGLSPGAGLVFLLVGPATNAATIVLLWRVLGRRATVIYLASIVVCALLGGVILDQVYTLSGTSPVVLARAVACRAAPSWFDQGATALLVGLVVYGLWRRYRKRFVRTGRPS